MSAHRKPLDPDCDGGIFCPVEGHTSTVSYKNGRIVFKHSPLTLGQRRTLRERRAALLNPTEGEEK